MKFDACVIGHITTDFIRIDGKIKSEIPGGTAYYTSMALKSLGLNVAVITRVSKERQSSLAGELERAGIRVFCKESEQTTVFENIYSRQDRDPRAQKVKSVASPFLPQDLAGMSASIFHVGPLTNVDVSPDFLREVALKGHPISLDVQGMLREITRSEVRAVNWQEKEKGLGYVNILKADEEEARILTGEEDLEKAALRLSDFGPEEVIITSGNRGSLILAHREFYTIPAFQVTEIVDTTGCGDTFMAGYIHERLKSHSFSRAGRLAAHCASLKLERFGALRPSDVTSSIQGREL